jgi:tRNA G46 methylase TrmB
LESTVVPLFPIFSKKSFPPPAFASTFFYLIYVPMEQSSQKPDHPPAQAVHHEWRTAENSAIFVLAKLQSMKETNPHLTLLDVGAGSGTISVTFAKAIPDGHVTAIDLKHDILPRAWANAEMAGIKNIEFQQGDAYKPT